MDTPELPPIIFQSRPDRGTGWRLAMFVVLAALGHTVVFYLFKVVTPSATRHLPPEESVLVLRGDDRATASVLVSLEDRSPAGMLVTLGRSAETNSPRLPLPTYTPSYENYRPPLRFDSQPAPTVLLHLADASRPLLPKSEKPASHPPRPALTLATGATPHLVLNPMFEARGLLNPPHWPAKLSPPEELDETHLFHVAIDATGNVRYCLADGVAPPPPITTAVQQLRFHSALGSPLLWGEIEVHW